MRKGLWLSTIAVAVLAACSGRATTSTIPPVGPTAPPTAPPPAQITVTIAGTLQYPGDFIKVVAKQGKYSGPFTFTSSNPKVLCLSLTPPPAATCSASVTSPNGVVYVIGEGPGNASITIVGKGGVTAKPDELQHLRIVVAPSVVADPEKLTFTKTGSENAQDVTITQPDFTGSFTAKIACSGVATFAEIRNGKGVADYRVTPDGKGSCTATFAGGYGKSAKLPVFVTTASPVVIKPSSLSFTGFAAKNVSVSQAGYTGEFDETNTCAHVAAVAEVKNASGKATFSVTPLRGGKCTATFTGADGVFETLPISIVIAGVVVTPGALTFTTSGSSSARPVSVSQSGFTGSFAESDDCAGKATIAEQHNGGGTASYSVSAVADGSCSVTFTGGGAESSPLAITVTLPGPVVLNPTALNFSGTGAGNAQNFTVTQAGYSGNFTESDDCAGVATVAANSRTSYAVTPVANGSCTVAVAGGNGQSAPLTVTVAIVGDVTASPSPVNFVAVGAANAVTVTVTQAGFGGTFGESDTCSGFATVSATSNAGGTATYLITPVAAGLCDVTFTGGKGASYVLGVSVTETGFGIQIRRTRGGRVRP